MKDTSDNILYPDDEFLDDLEQWHQTVMNPRSPWYRNNTEAAKVVFSLRYANDRPAFRYRMNRFDCIQRAVDQGMKLLTQDRIALPSKGDGAQIPEHLYLALLAWYRSVPDAATKKMPDPDWPEVLEEYDRLDALHN